MPARSPDLLHERDDEIATLEQALADAVSGHGRAVLVEGSAGVGKSRLLDELCARAAGGAVVLRARGGEQERDVPLLVARELFAPFVASADGAQLDRVFTGAAAQAGPLLGRGTADLAGSDPGFALVHGLYWLVANLAEQRPLVLVVDDVHWVDEASQRWLAYLLPRVEEHPVLLVLAVRPRELAPGGPLGRGLARAPGVAVVRLAALSERSSRLVVEALLPDADEDFCAAAHRSTGGNPLLLRSLCSAVRERGISPDAVHAQRLDEVGVLELGRIVLPRLHALGRAPLLLARAVAILGDGCELVDAAAVAGLERREAGPAWDALVSAEILDGADAPCFTHPLVRAIVHEEIAPGSRNAFQLEAARVLCARAADPEDVARHLASTDRVGEPWVVPVLREAADLAARRGAPQASVAFLAAALREELAPAERFDVLLAAGWHAFRALDPRGRAWFEHALELAPDDAAAVRAWGALWNWRLIVKDGHDPAGVLSGLPGSVDPSLTYALQTIFLLDLGFTGANLRRMVDLYPVPSLRPRAASVSEQRWLCARALDETVAGGTAAQALALLAQVDHHRLLDSRTADTPNIAWLILARAGAGDLVGATSVAQEALGAARNRGSRAATEWYALAVGIVHLERGDLLQAAATLEPWLEELTERPLPISAPSLCGAVVRVHLERGNPERAETLLSSRGFAGGGVPPDWHGAYLLHMRARLREAAGGHAAALADHERTRDVLGSFDALENPLAPWRLGMASCLLALGRTAEAGDLALEQVARARQFGAAPLLGRSLRVLATVLGVAEGEAPAEEAVEVLAGSDARGEHAHAQVVLGRLLRLGRQPGRARAVLEDALESAERRGAVLMANQAEAELRLTGARPRRRAVTGIHALTPAELRVATMAAQGLSNPAIAQSLFVTRKTVEKHLGSTFLKLDIKSRDELAAVLR